MSSSEGERTGRRGFFLSLAASLGEAMASAGEQLASGESLPSPLEALTEAPALAPKRLSVPPAAIPDVRR